MYNRKTDVQFLKPENATFSFLNSESSFKLFKRETFAALPYMLRNCHIQKKFYADLFEANSGKKKSTSHSLQLSNSEIKFETQRFRKQSNT